MSKNKILGIIHYETFFESLKRIYFGQEYWHLGEFSKALGYTTIRSFSSVLRKAKTSCQQSGYKVSEHFKYEGNGAWLSDEKRPLSSRHLLLSRYACYLLIQNANPQKEMVAMGQSYFALQTRKQELLTKENTTLTYAEEQSRLLLRNQITRHNKELARVAKKAGVMSPEEFSAFQNLGYQGLYGGLDHKRLHEKKGLKKSQKVLDYMGSTELAANLFRATQTEEKLKHSQIQSREIAYQLHYNVGRQVRDTIKALGGTLPEDLSISPVSIKAIERKQTKFITEPSQ